MQDVLADLPVHDKGVPTYRSDLRSPGKGIERACRGEAFRKEGELALDPRIGRFAISPQRLLRNAFPTLALRLR